MQDWIPLFQSLVWPVILILILLVARKQVSSILSAIARRVGSGDAVKAGPFALGKSIPQDAYSPKSPQGTSSEPQDSSEMPARIERVRELRLVHEIGQWGVDRDGYERRDVVVWLEPYPEAVAETIDRVVYYLPESWPKHLRVQSKDNPKDGFRLKTRAYGEVTVGAEVHFKNGRPPIIINRYCNFYGGDKNQ